MRNNLLELLRKCGWQKREPLYRSCMKTAFVPRRSKKLDASCIVITNRSHTNTEICLSQLRANRNVEIIFVNNGGGSNIKHDHPLVDKHIMTRADYGAYRPRNIGAAFASGKYLIFVDDDGIPHRNMIRELLAAHAKYDIVSCCGCCKPITASPWNYDCHHYYLGPRPFPYWTNLEGNCCIRADVFFAAGGWDDNLRYGGGGYELSVRMLSIEPDKRKCAYIPDAILFHDYCKGARHLAEKRAVQIHQAQKRFFANPRYFQPRDAWLWMAGKEHLLIKR